ncbi:MAG: hypothetical protein K2X61_02630 [Caulobacteraceae bacterium]|nr:hypothetical protein [Caulobacteraceae bacterium]
MNAPPMQRLDAARLLLALAVTDRPSRAAQAVIDFGQLSDIDDGSQSAELGLANALAKLADEPGSWRVACHVHVQRLAVELIMVDEFGLSSALEGEGTGEMPAKTQHFLHPNYAIPPSDSDDPADSAAEHARDQAVAEVQARYFNRLQVTRTIPPVLLDEIAALFAAAEAPAAPPPGDGQ